MNSADRPRKRYAMLFRTRNWAKERSGVEAPGIQIALHCEAVDLPVWLLSDVLYRPRRCVPTRARVFLL